MSTFESKTGKPVHSKSKLIIVLIVVAITALLFVPFLINSDSSYEEKDGKMYFGNKELSGVNPDEVRMIDYYIIKDSSHIYYKDQILEWADRETFRIMRPPFFIDKNGIYYETHSLFSKREIKPLEGDYDKPTFHSVSNSTFFKDKNRVYQIDIRNVSQAPLSVVNIPEIDVATFEMEGNSYWYADKNHVYFGIFDLKLCKEIDKQSFETLSFQVAKDKNHVYYLTRNLKSDDKKATDYDNYTILTDADAPSFVMIDELNYTDKNTTWTIER
jgi:hypothetical protein